MVEVLSEPPIPTGGKMEPVLKIEAKSLRRKWVPKPRVHPPSSGTRNSRTSRDRRSFDKPINIRCRCELTIYEKPDPLRAAKLSNVRRTRSRSREESSTNPLVRYRQFCTIAYDSEEFATIEMQDPFYIRAGELFVFTNRGPIQSFGLAESYTAEFALQPISTDQPWPPLDSNSSGRWDDPTNVQLVGVFHSLPMAPASASHELEFRTGILGETGERADIELELDCKWDKQGTITRGGEAYQLVSPRLPTPVSERGRDFSPVDSVLTCYVFSSPVDEERFHPCIEQPTIKHQHAFTVPRYICPFCDGRELTNLTSLHFHLITSHDLFQFKVRPNKAKGGLRGNESHENYVEVFVDLARDAMVGRASDHVPDHRTFRWVKPSEILDVDRILNGDWSWLNERRGMSLQNRRDTTAGGTLVPFSKKRINLNEVGDLPVNKRRKYRVPVPMNGLQGLVFIRSRSKRFVYPDEELSESDDDVDEGWLQMEHKEIIEDFTDVARNEMTFMQLWDRHLFLERPIGYSHIPQVLIRFAREQAENMRTSQLLVEFWKHCLNLVQYGIIDTECVAFCMRVIKGEGQWSSAGQTKWGIGLSGPLVLDAQEAAPTKVEDTDVIDCLQAPEIISGFCTCGKPFDKPEMVLCNGNKCNTRWFHRSCVDAERMQEGWRCKICQEEVQSGS
ncbi:VEFS-Box of polycomb protein-domain-containing protein [Tuber indicum]|nr:VEFS-Box of polycomb protein-domain-containing protein [Tuber indicum]